MTVCQWKPISTAPLDKWVLLWWIGHETKAPPTCIIGQVSSHEPGQVWGSEIYRPIEWFTHWDEMPEGPARAHGESRPEEAKK